MASFKDDPDYLGPISATPQKMVEEMLAVAGVTAADVVFDLGCNDGRVLVTAAANAGARGVGVEIDENAVKKARTKVRATSSSRPRRPFRDRRPRPVWFSHPKNQTEWAPPTRTNVLLLTTPPAPNPHLIPTSGRRGWRGTPRGDQARQRVRGGRPCRRHGLFRVSPSQGQRQAVRKVDALDGAGLSRRDVRVSVTEGALGRTPGDV